MRFVYRAARIDRALETGVLEAPTRRAASSMLGDRGLFPLEISPETEPPIRQQRLSAEDWALGLNLLRDFLVTGMPLDKSLTALEDVAPPAWRSLLTDMRRRVQEGSSLAEALQQGPVAPPAVVVGLVRAGETAGNLSHAIDRAAALMTTTASHRAALLSALSYPALLLIAGMLSIAFLVVFVLPRFVAILTDLGGPLPVTTRMLMHGAEIARSMAAPAVATVVALLIGWKAWVRTPTGRIHWHECLLALPVVGGLRHAMATARAASTLAALLESGVPLARALLHAGGVTGDAAVEARLLETREAVVRGSSFSSALRSTSSLTPTAVRLTAAGEETGELAPMLAKAASLEHARTERTLRALVRVLEPGLILVFGGFVALIAASLLQALYGIRPG